MFGWLKRWLGNSTPSSPSPSGAEAAPEVLSVSTVVDRYLLQNPQKTPYMVHALVAAGATSLASPSDLQLACRKIEEHGGRFPFNPTLRNELPPEDWLDFLRWHQRHQLAPDAYEHEHQIRLLIEDFRGQR